MLNSKSDTDMNYNAKRSFIYLQTLKMFFAPKKQINTLTIHSQTGALNVRITVEYLGYIKQTLKITQPEIIELKSEATTRDLLVLLASKFGDAFKKAVYDPKDNNALKPYHILAVNGLMINLLNGLDTKLKDGDRVSVMPVVTGG
jgi:molybdopterin synthase sulfur carrier subunit